MLKNKNNTLMMKVFKHHISQNSELFVIVKKILETNRFKESHIQKVTSDFLEHEKVMIKNFEELKGKFTLYITDEHLPNNSWSAIHEDFFRNEAKMEELKMSKLIYQETITGETRMQGENNSFRYIEKNEVKWIAGGIFETLWERKMAEFFPLFGQHSVHNQEALAFIIEKYELNKIEIKDLDIHLRSHNCLKKANIQTLDKVLMMYPRQLSLIINWGRKSTINMQKVAGKKLGIEI